MKSRSDAEKALGLQAVARKKRATARAIAAEDPTGARFWRYEAEDADQQAASLLELPEAPEIGVGNELVPPGGYEGTNHYLVHTLTQPDAVTAEASLERLNLAENAGSLAMAVDAAETIQAQNSLEKMLAHQMAAAHGAAMRIFARAEDEMRRCEYQGAHERHEAQLSATRLLNTSARLMGSFQDGMTTLHRMRRGGQQTVTVQHVQVSDGGQAVVAGSVESGNRGPVRGDDRET
jgi:hypothetical protein